MRKVKGNLRKSTAILPIWIKRHVCGFKPFSTSTSFFSLYPFWPAHYFPRLPPIVLAPLTISSSLIFIWFPLTFSSHITEIAFPQPYTFQWEAGHAFPRQRTDEFIDRRLPLKVLPIGSYSVDTIIDIRPAKQPPPPPMFKKHSGLREENAMAENTGTGENQPLII